MIGHSEWWVLAPTGVWKVRPPADATPTTTKWNLWSSASACRVVRWALGLSWLHFIPHLYIKWTARLLDRMGILPVDTRFRDVYSATSLVSQLDHSSHFVQPCRPGDDAARQTHVSRWRRDVLVQIQISPVFVHSCPLRCCVNVYSFEFVSTLCYTYWVLLPI